MPPSPKMASLKIPSKVMREVGEAMVNALSRAAANEFARRKWSVRSRDGRTVITRSFFYKVLDGGGGVQIHSTFPGVESFATGIPVNRDAEGNMIIHRGPLTLGNVWVHPGARKGNFLFRGLEKGKKAAHKILAEEVKRQLLAGDLFK